MSISKVTSWLTENNYTHYQDFRIGEILLSSAFINKKTMVVVDYDAIFLVDFSYKRYCQKQNEWMRKFPKMYRFHQDNIDDVRSFLNNVETDFYEGRTMNRELLVIDPSPLEYHFENCFALAYGNEAYRYLLREYSYILHDGRTGYVDYVLQKNDGTWVAIEENGVTYHHPYIVKKEIYEKVLLKQNSVIEQNGIVFRWDSESILDSEKTADEIREFIGDIELYKVQTSYKNQRKFELYQHQQDYLEHLLLTRKQGLKSALVVLPVGTGKTTVAIEDIINAKVKDGYAKILVLVPSIELRLQWIKEISKSRLDNSFIDVETYNKVSRHYFIDDPKEYDYIVVDEAHHAVAPVIRKVLHHYNPKFLIGLTATDKRLDEKKLEEVFGSYETKMNLREAIEKGILAPIRAYRLETNVDLSEIKFNGKDYVNNQLEKSIRVPSRNEAIAMVLKMYFLDRLKGKSGVVFCINIAHSKEMANVLKKKGFNAESIDGKDKCRSQKLNNYMNGNIQFLCTCSLLTEGWDAPHTSIVVMARPTMSKVLYTQQLGRGTRKYPGKEALYVIDVVDNYGNAGFKSNRAWSVHTLLGTNTYGPFHNLINRHVQSEELVILDTIHEVPIKLSPYDVFTFEKYYGDYLSEEQLARILFVSTGTVKNWIRKKGIIPDLTLPFGTRKLHYFAPEAVGKIRSDNGLKEHTDQTIIGDFWDFIEKGDYSFSYKMYFMLSVLDNINETGDANLDDVLSTYIHYYTKRHEENLIVDRRNSPYNSIEYLNNIKKMKSSLLTNPFEKFERKRFFYHSKQKDLAKISMHHLLWDEINDKNGMERLRNKMTSDLKDYYRGLTVDTA